MTQLGYHSSLVKPGQPSPGQVGGSRPDNDGQIEVALRREPSQDELEHTNRVVQSALAEFRHRPAQQR